MVVTLDRRFMWTDAYLERKLKKAQAEERRKKKGTTDLSSSVFGKVLLYGGYFWAARLAFVAFGSGLPLLGAFLSLFLPQPRNGLQTLPTAAHLPPNNAVFSLRHSSPLLVQNSSLALESLRDVPYQKVFVQPAQEDVFSSFDETAPWASLLTTQAAWDRARKYRVETFAEEGTLGSLHGFPFTSSTADSTCQKDEEGGGEACVYPPPPPSRKRKNNWHIKQSISSVKVGKFAPELLSTLAPAPAPAAASSSDAPQVDFDLWLGKENVTLAPQYFTHNSVLLQVQGQSTVLIASPDAFRFYHPGSVLHPGRSQAQRDYLLTPAQIDRAIRGELVRSDYEGESLPAVAYWHNALGPGDLLLVPAFYYVTAVLGPNCATILGRPNQTLYPPLFLLYAHHNKEESDSSGPVPLPFDETGTDVGVKLAALGSAVGSLIADPVVRGRYTASFVKRVWRDRHRKSAYLTKGRGDGSSLWCERDDASYGTCTSEARQLVEKDKEYQVRALSTVHALTLLLLQTDELAYTAMTTTEEEVGEGQAFAIRIQMTLDWTERQLHRILSDNNSNPCAILRFIETCLAQ